MFYIGNICINGRPTYVTVKCIHMLFYLIIFKFTTYYLGF